MAPLPDSPPPYGTVVFDCDSTLSRIEGIEELAQDCRAEVEALTSRAMDGSLRLEEAYGARLELIRPSAEALDAVAACYVREALPHAKHLVGALQALGKRVVVVSGGLLPAVRAFAADLGISSADCVHAVEIHFDRQGRYAGYESGSPLARSGGKISVLREISAHAGAGAVAFIGDGATDLEAAHEVARFIAFGGVVRRPKIFEAAKITCATADFAALVPLLLAEEERSDLANMGNHHELLEAAAIHLNP